MASWGVPGRGGGGVASGKFMGPQVLCAFLDVCYIHSERVLPKGKRRLNQVHGIRNSFFPR